MCCSLFVFARDCLRVRSAIVRACFVFVLCRRVLVCVCFCLVVSV